MAVLLVGVAATPAAADTTAATQRLIVGVTHDADRAALVAGIGDLALGWRPVRGLDAITVDVPADRVADAFAAWGDDPAIRYRGQDYPLHADGSGDESDDETTAFGYRAVDRIAGAQTWTTGSPAITVAVVDTGVTPNGVLAADRLTAGYDFVDDDADPADGGAHGTMMAGLIAGDNKAGVCPQCRIMPVRVLRDQASGPATGNASDVAAGIVWAADHGARIVNVSASSDATDDLMREAVAYAAAKDVLVVASSGNSDQPSHGYPANIDPVVAVGAHNSSGLPRVGTNRNLPGDHWLDTSAACCLEAMDPTGSLRTIYGTSPAAAIVSGAAALAYAIKPDLTAVEVRDRIAATSGKVPSPSADISVLDAARLVHGLGVEDTEPPVVNRTGLDEGQLINKVTGVGVLPQATDDHAVERMDFLLGGKVIGQWTPWQRTVWLHAPADYQGDYPVTVKAYDYAGHTAERSTTVHVDGAGPAGQFTQPAAEAHVRGSFPVVVTSTDDDVASVTVNEMAMTRTGDRTWSATVTPPADGRLWVTLWDKAGNWSQITRHVVLDTSGPTATTFSPATNARVRGTFTAGIGGVADPAGVTTVQLWANGAYVGAGRSLKVRTGTRSGNVTLLWKLTDRLGNVRSYTRVVVADNTAPSLTITKAPKNKAKVKGTVKVTVSAKDAGGIAKVQLLINGKVVATDTRAGYVLSFNTNKVARTMRVQVRAYDKLGNVRYTAARTWRRK